MRNLLLTIGVFAVGYTLYREWMKTQDLKKRVDDMQVQTNVALKKVAMMTGGELPSRNAKTFREMKGVFDADVSRTVAPSVNAKIGIF